MNKRAFTLVDLLIVVAMVFILFTLIFNLASGGCSQVNIHTNFHQSRGIFEPSCMECISWKNKNLSDQLKNKNLSDDQIRKAVENSQ